MRVRDDVLAMPVRGQGLDAATFGEALRGEATLVVFLRHFG